MSLSSLQNSFHNIVLNADQFLVRKYLTICNCLMVLVLSVFACHCTLLIVQWASSIRYPSEERRCFQGGQDMEPDADCTDSVMISTP